MDVGEDSVLKTVKHSIPLDVLDDLCSRFIINVPDGAKQNLVRICFQIELAHWFYLDFYCTDENAKLKSCGIREFAAHIFQHIPFLQPFSDRLGHVLDEWREYKQSVPTYGAILLSENMSHVLLVQSYWAKSSWGFPKGKVNEDEEPAHCAVREVLEETGFDITNLIDKNEFIESVINDQLVRLYIISGIDRSTKFEPRTRCEIRACEWFALIDLPTTKKDLTPKVKMGISAKPFFMVLPFVKRMKKWVSDRSKQNSQTKKSSKKTTYNIAGDESSRRSNVPTPHQEDERLKSVSPNSSSKSAFRKNDKRPSSKRQLFVESDKYLKDDQEIEFTAPSWDDFRFRWNLIF